MVAAVTAQWCWATQLLSSACMLTNLCAHPQVYCALTPFISYDYDTGEGQVVQRMDGMMQRIMGGGGSATRSEQGMPVGVPCMQQAPRDAGDIRLRLCLFWGF